MELISTLTEKLGISPAQAEGGTGMILKLLKGQLAGDQFAKVEEAVPEADQYVAAAEAAEAEDSGGGGGLMGAPGGVASSFGAGKLGMLATLVAGFSKLGLGKEQIAKFTEIFFGFLKSKGAGDAATAAQQAFSE